MISGACVAVGGPIAHLAGRLEFCIADRVRGVRGEYVVDITVEIIADAENFESRGGVDAEGGRDSLQRRDGDADDFEELPRSCGLAAEVDPVVNRRIDPAADSHRAVLLPDIGNISFDQVFL